MGSVLQFALLFACWLAALATLLIFLETWFALSGIHRFLARRASGAYGVLSVLIPMRGSPAKVEETIRSIFGQSYPFIELVLIFPHEERAFAKAAKEFRSARSHIPVRLVTTPFPIDSPNDRIRALEYALPNARGRWLVVVEPDIVLDRFAIETALEFAGSNEVSALVLKPGVRCRSAVQRIVAPSMEQLRQTIRIGHRRRERNKPLEGEASFLLFHREAFDVVNRINRMPGILNDAGWNVWGYQVEGLRTFEGDGARWLWRDADMRSWLSDTEPERRYGMRSRTIVLTSALMATVAAAGIAYAFTYGFANFMGGSILAFSAVSYALTAVSYFLFARRLGAAAWFAPFWIFSHLPAAVLTLAEMRRISEGTPKAQEGTATKGTKSTKSFLCLLCFLMCFL